MIKHSFTHLLKHHNTFILERLRTINSHVGKFTLAVYITREIILGACSVSFGTGLFSERAWLSGTRSRGESVSEELIYGERETTRAANQSFVLGNERRRLQSTARECECAREREKQSQLLIDKLRQQHVLSKVQTSGCRSADFCIPSSSFTVREKCWSENRRWSCRQKLPTCQLQVEIWRRFSAQHFAPSPSLVCGDERHSWLQRTLWRFSP
jgi:hypothetical protein